MTDSVPQLTVNTKQPSEHVLNISSDANEPVETSFLNHVKKMKSLLSFVVLAFGGCLVLLVPAIAFSINHVNNISHHRHQTLAIFN